MKKKEQKLKEQVLKVLDNMVSKHDIDFENGEAILLNFGLIQQVKI